MYVYPQSVYFSWIAVQTQIIVTRQIWYHLIDNFMRNNFGKRYFMHIPFNFQKKIEKTVKKYQEETPKCGSVRAEDEGFLSHD